MSTRAQALAQAKRMCQRARFRSRVDLKTLSVTLDVSRQRTHRLVSENHPDQILSMTDLVLLAREPNAAEFLRVLLCELQVLVDQGQLRVSDVEVMATAPHTRHLALAALRRSIALLFPDMKFTPPAPSAPPTGFPKPAALPAAILTEVKARSSKKRMVSRRSSSHR